MPQGKQEDSVGRKGFGTTGLAMAGMLAALVVVATCFLKLPVPMYSGYVHLGDGFILLGAVMLGYGAVPAAAVGSLLSDLLLGFAPYALPTFVVKGCVALVAVAATRAKNPWLRGLLFLLAECAMVAGYFLAEWLILGYGFPGAWANVPGNAVQGISGVVLAVVFYPVIGRIKLPGIKPRRDM